MNRDLNSLQLKTPSGQILSFYILQTFPFTSESKRMGIIVRVSMYSSKLCFSVYSVFLNKGTFCVLFYPWIFVLISCLVHCEGIHLFSCLNILVLLTESNSLYFKFFLGRVYWRHYFLHEGGRCCHGEHCPV